MLCQSIISLIQREKKESAKTFPSHLYLDAGDQALLQREAEGRVEEVSDGCVGGGRLVHGAVGPAPLRVG